MFGLPNGLPNWFAQRNCPIELRNATQRLSTAALIRSRVVAMPALSSSS